jgi:hypothetical protein
MSAVPKSKDDRMRDMLDARAADSQAPLIRDPLPREPYPLDFIQEACPLLGHAIADVARAAQADPSVAGGAILSAAALLSQTHADVEVGSRRYPTSLFFLTVAASGERKGEADWLVLRAISEHERREAARHRTNPEGMRNPRMLDSDPTLEGLVRSFEKGTPSRLIACADGGLFVGGHAMGKDHRIKTAAGLTLVWDGKPITRTRATTREETTYYGRRVSMHLQGQSAAVGAFVNDPALKNQGFLARCLITVPPIITGRTFEIVPQTALPGLSTFRRWQTEILARRPPFRIYDEDETDELDPAVIAFDDDSVDLYGVAYDVTQRAIEPGGEWEDIREFGTRLPEHAARLAGVFAFASDCPTVEPIHLEGALALAQGHASEWLRATEATAADVELGRANTLLGWLRRQGRQVFTLRGIYREGPRAIRSVSAARSAVSILVDYGHAQWTNEGSTFVLTGAP